MNSKNKIELDRVFSLYIRKKFGNVCFICGSAFNIQNGHCFKRGNLATRYNENNCRPQCENCNCFLDTDNEFKVKLRAEIGDVLFEQIEQLSRLDVKISDREAKEMIKYYKLKL